MRIASYTTAHGPSFGIVIAGGTVDLGRRMPYADISAVLAAGALPELAVHAAAAPDFACALRAGLRVRWLERTAMMAITAAPPDVERPNMHLGVKRESLAQILLLPSWRYSLAELRTLLVTPEDIKQLGPGQRISLAYLLVRFWRWVWRRIRGSTAG